MPVDEVAIASEPSVDATESVETTAEVLAPEVDTTEQATETQDTEKTDDTQDGQGEIQVDGRAMPQQFKDLLKDPKYKAVAKTIRDDHFTVKALKTEFPRGLAEAREYKQLHDDLGGREGVESLRADSVSLDTADNMLRDGDPQIIETIASDFPQGLAKLAPKFIEKWQQVDKPGFEHAMAKIIVGATRQSFERAYQALEKVDAAAAKEIADAFNYLHDLSQKAPENKPDPKQQELDQRAQALEQQEVKSFQSGVAKELETFINGKRDSLMNQYLKPYGQTVEALKTKDKELYQEVAKAADNFISKKLNQDVAWTKTYRNLLSSKDHAKSVNHAQARIDKILPEALKYATGLFFRFAGAKKQVQAPAATPAKPGTMKLTNKPKPSDVDYSRTSPEMIQNHEAYLKGKTQRFSWA